MEYVDILSMVVDSDRNTTKELLPLINAVPTDYFPDSTILSNTAIINGTRDGMFVAVSKKDDIVVLKLYSAGTGTQKSCTKKVKIEFVPQLEQKLFELQPNKPAHDIATDLQYQQLCMVSTLYTRKASNSIAYTPYKPQYTICYYLRKNNNNQFFLQSEIREYKPRTYNNVKINELSIFNKIKPSFQKDLNEAYIADELEEFEEFENMEELKDLYNFNDVDYNEDDLVELMDENQYQNDDLENNDLSI